MYRLPLLLAVLLWGCFCTAQEENVFSRVSQADIDLKIYPKDTTASAVVLFEKGDLNFQFFGTRLYLIKSFSFKIKILKKEGYPKATVEIPFYSYYANREEVYGIKGITHNGMEQTILAEEDIFTLKDNPWWSTKRFSMPNIKPGSIIQYTYKIKTPFIYDFEGWHFQSNIPKIHSEFNAKIPGSYQYNKNFYGKLKMQVQETYRENYCMKFAERPDLDCEVLKYVMKDVPAFNDTEKYMLAPSNYISRLEFELATIYRFDGTQEHFTKTWEEVDKKFKDYYDIGKQLGKNHFFKKQLAYNNLAKDAKLNTAKSIYYFIRSHFNWNKDYRIFREIKVKDAFNKKVGNAGEINITLVNMLRAAGINTKPMLLSTRRHGLLSKNKPALDDFNYVVALAEVAGETFVLDATDKKIPFGMLPYRCLNHLGRVMDFEEGSYWHTVTPYTKNRTNIRGFANLNLEENTITGKIAEINQGYPAIEKYKELDKMEAQEYLDEIANTSVAEMYFENYQKNEKKSKDDLLSETYEFVIEDAISDGKIYLNPIVIKWWESNPFKSEKRNFPVDFGYPFSAEYQMNIKVPEGFKVQSLPKDKTIALTSELGLLDLRCKEQSGMVQLRFKLAITKAYFDHMEYDFLKNFFSEAVDAQNNSVIVFEKK